MNLKRSLISILVIVVAVVATTLITIETTADPSGAASSTQPPDAEPAEARVVSSGDFVDANIEQYLREQEQSDIEKRRAEIAAEEEEARRRSASRSYQPTSASYGSFNSDCATLSSQMNLPESILWRESRCSWAYNPTGCGGRGCLGPAQLDAGHFSHVSPWNSSASGSCAGLNPEVQSEYIDCVNILSSGGKNLRPWNF